MPSAPLISVCVPLYNKGSHIEKTLTSLLNQDYPNLEIVVSDNGSTDGSGEIVRQLAAGDSRIRYFRLEHTVSINESWRYCMRLASGELIKLHSGDDETLRSSTLSTLQAPLGVDPSLDFSVCEVRPKFLFTDTGLNTAAFANAYKSIASTNRSVIACKTRAEKARLLFLAAGTGNGVGTQYGALVRRGALPHGHWGKSRAPYAWPEAYPDWDFMIRLLLNHRGVFVESLTIEMEYGANSPVCKQQYDIEYEIFDAVAKTLVSFNTLFDPDLVELRLAATADSLTQVRSTYSHDLGVLLSLTAQRDSLVADAPLRAALPAYREYAAKFRKEPSAGALARRLRQLRWQLAGFWHSVDATFVQRAFEGAYGALHRTLVWSNVGQLTLDPREVDRAQDALARFWNSRDLRYVLIYQLFAGPQLGPVSLPIDAIPNWFLAAQSLPIDTAFDGISDSQTTIASAG